MRDNNGRWVKGVSGNPNGRPTKLSTVDTGDLVRFMNTLVEVPTPDGRIVLMTREAAIQERMYAAAMKGNVHALMFFSRRFEKHMQGQAEIIGHLNELTADIVEKKRHPTEEEAQWIYKARIALHELPRPGQVFKQPRSRPKPRSAAGQGKRPPTTDRT